MRIYSILITGVVLNDLKADKSLKQPKILQGNEKHDILKRKPIFLNLNCCSYKPNYKYTL